MSTMKLSTAACAGPAYDQNRSGTQRKNALLRSAWKIYMAETPSYAGPERPFFRRPARPGYAQGNVELCWRLGEQFLELLRMDPQQLLEI